MAGRKEEKGSLEAVEWMLRPCTAAKSEKDAVASVEMQCPTTKRKAEAGSSYKAGDSPPEGWIDVYKEAEPASLDPFGSQSSAKAIDKMLQDAILVKQAPGGSGSKLTRRLTKGEIMSIIALKPEPFPSADYLDELADFYPPESIAEKKRQHKEDAAYFGDGDKKYEAFRQRVIKGLEEHGYYEVDEDFLASKEKANEPAWTPFAFLDPEDLRSRVATPEQQQRWLQEGSIRQYVPSAEDVRLICCGDSDESDEEEDAEADKGHPIEAN